MAQNSTDCVIGWDIGGAHLKAARVFADGRIDAAVQLPCALWQGLDQLTTSVDEAKRRLGPTDGHAITMTGELADLFGSRAEGVVKILDVMTEKLRGQRIQVFAGADGFVDPAHAHHHLAAISSANWRATAELVALHQPDALLLDIGSTTSDLVPIAEGHVAAEGHDDATRLKHEELLYMGVVRTPLMALGQKWALEGRVTAICNELFATTADVYRLTSDLHEEWDQYPPADGGAKTREASARRIARMVGRDLDSASLETWIGLAFWLKATQVDIVRQAIRRITLRSGIAAKVPIVGAGAGSFLAREIASVEGRSYVAFADIIGRNESPSSISTCAPAVAVGCLALRL
ncbi:MAG TPA: hydantoinase/oxoprolinase family protein [Rhodocyclaceae bacterium]|nr:hydantoinase/oxoprolinase family protein [Rhodocyclaceae bacterium]